jgi:hypothetical protein
MPDPHLEALLSARLFLEPQLVGGRVYLLHPPTPITPRPG